MRPPRSSLTLRRWGLAFVLSSLLTMNAFAQTVIFQDNFDGASPTMGPQWGLQQGWRVNGGRAVTDDSYSLSTAQFFPQTDYAIETVPFNLARGYQRAYRLHFGQTDLAVDNYYTVEYNTDGGIHFKLGRSEGNPNFPEVLAQIDLPTELVEYTDYRIRVERRASGEIRVFLAKETEAYPSAPTLVATDTTYPTLGSFGWQAVTQGPPQRFYLESIQATTLPLLTAVQASNGKTYGVAAAQVGTPYYIDRSYTFTALPPYLKGADVLRTANDDKPLASPATGFLQFRVEKPALVYVAYDPRSTRLPGWLSDFSPVPDVVGTTDPGSSTMKLFARFYAAGTKATLGANLAAPAAGSNLMYVVFAVPAPPEANYQAELATAQGPVLAAAYPGYQGSGYLDYQAASQEYIEWTVNVPAAGPYYLGLRYALNGGTRCLRLQVNGATVSAALAFPATGSWSTWQYNAQKAVLKAGANTIRLTSIGSSGPNVDLLRLFNSQPAGSSGLLAGPAPQAGASSGAENLGALALQVGNPVAEAASFRYQLPAAAQVRLRIFDWRGRPVGTLVDGWQASGTQQVQWPATNWQPSIYLYRLEVGKEVRSGRLQKD